MNLAVKLYSAMPTDDENILAGIDGKIPAEVIFGVDEASSEDYQIMTEEEYKVYLISIDTEIQNWKTIQTEITL